MGEFHHNTDDMFLDMYNTNRHVYMIHFPRECQYAFSNILINV